MACRRCPRLNAWREEAASHPPKRFAGQRYWAKPVPGVRRPERADPDRGARAGRARGKSHRPRFSRATPRATFSFLPSTPSGFANQPESRDPGDGLALSGALISAVCRCAPPDNRPLPEEIENCREYLERELALLPRPRVLVALGALAFDRCLRALQAAGAGLPKPRPRFAHGARVRIGEDVLFATYHPSQQNTFTGKLTQKMLRDVLRRARQAAGCSVSAGPAS